MSQLIERLNRVAKIAPQPLGFRVLQPAPARAGMLLIACPADTVNGLVDSGVDAVLLRFDKGAESKILQKQVRSLSAPWGGWLKDAGSKDAAGLVEAGADFLVFPMSGAVAAIPVNEKVGRVLQVTTELADGILRTANNLPVDAVLVDDKIEDLTWERLMSVQRAASLLTKPLLITIPLGLALAELQALWEAGVDAVVVMVSKEDLVRLKELRQEISKIDISKRKRGRGEALVPTIKMAPPSEAKEEEEEGDEEE